MEFFKKNGFWIASFLLVAAMIGTWFYATGAIQAATDTRVSAINSAKSSAESVLKVEAEPESGAHPNKSTEEGMKEKLAAMTESVIEAWQKRYDAQKAILKWPERSLGPVFIGEFGKYSPPETWPEEDKGDSIRIKSLLEVYQQQVPEQMKRICEIIQTNWQFQDQLDRVANADERDADGDEDQDDQSADSSNVSSLSVKREIVRWNPTNQELWFQKLTRFQGRDDNTFTINRPTPSQVYMLQQDLWLLEAIFDIVRNVNARMIDGKMMMGPDNKPVMVQANDLAPVKEIDHVVFGREALALLGEIKDTITSAGQSGSARQAVGRSSGRTKSQASDTALTYAGEPAFHGRYVNAKLEPIQAATIRKVLSEKTLPADNLELVVAKRVPVRLAVRMDEREIPRFLAACANSPFAFEVWQVRINKHSSEEEIKLRGGIGRGSRGGGNGRGEGRGNIGAAGGTNSGGFGGGGRTGSNRPNQASTIALREDFDVGVEFYGIVKIYNPVNAELLTGEKSDASATP